VEEYTSALATSPHDFFARCNRCVVNSLLGNSAAALMDSQVLSEKFPRVPLSYLLRSRVAKTSEEAALWLCVGLDENNDNPVLLRKLEERLRNDDDNNHVLVVGLETSTAYLCFHTSFPTLKLPGVKLLDDGRVVMLHAQQQLELEAVNGTPTRCLVLSPPRLVVCRFGVPEIDNNAGATPLSFHDILMVRGCGIDNVNGMYIAQAMRNEVPLFQNDKGYSLSKEAANNGVCGWVLGLPHRRQLVFVCDPARSSEGAVVVGAKPEDWMGSRHTTPPNEVRVLEWPLPSLRCLMEEDDRLSPVQVVLAIKGYGLRLAQDGFFMDAKKCFDAVVERCYAMALMSEEGQQSEMVALVMREARMARLACLVEGGQGVTLEAKREAAALVKMMPANEAVLRKWMPQLISAQQPVNTRQASSRLMEGVPGVRLSRRRSSRLSTRRTLVLDPDGETVILEGAKPVACFPSTTSASSSSAIRITRAQCAQVKPGPGATSLTMVLRGAAKKHVVLDATNAGERDALVTDLRAWLDV
jgi:hypothetical protein